MASVYIGLSLDFIHHGHIALIQKAREFGDITIGLLTDKAILEHKNLPYLTYEQREVIALNIQGVAEVVRQETWDYSANVRKYKPDFFIHGDDWNTGFEKNIKQTSFGLFDMPIFPGQLLGCFARGAPLGNQHI